MGTIRAMRLLSDVDDLARSHALQDGDCLLPAWSPAAWRRPGTSPFRRRLHGPTIAPVDVAQQPAAWHDFFVAGATAAAALLGLFFVAMSLHLQQVESHPVLRNRARINLQALATLLVGCLCILIPGQGNVWLGAELIVSTGVYLLIAVRGVAGARRSAGRLPRDVWFRLASENTVTLLIIAAGVTLIVGRGPALFLEAAAILVGLPIVTYNAWNVLFAPELRSPAPGWDASPSRRPEPTRSY